MGNTNSQIDFEYKITVNDFKPIQKVKDPYFGDIVQMTNERTGQCLYVREKVISNPNIKKFIEESISQTSLKHPNLSQVYGLATADTNGKSYTKPKMFLYFEHFEDNLRKVIDARKNPVSIKTSNPNKSGQFFTEGELFNILVQLVDVLQLLQENNISHGDIRPETCYMTKENKLKIFNRKLIFDDISAFQLGKDGDQNVFLTPLAYESLKKKKGEPNEDKHKADMFSLGMTILECATLKSSSQIYDWSTLTLNLSLLSNRLLEVKERYSLTFYSIIKEMLRLEENQRPDFSLLMRKLVQEGKFGLATHALRHSEEENSTGKGNPHMFEETEAKRQKDVLETNRDAPKPTTSSHLRKKFYESFKEEAVPVEPEANVNRVPQKAKHENASANQDLHPSINDKIKGKFSKLRNINNQDPQPLQNRAEGPKNNRAIFAQKLKIDVEDETNQTEQSIMRDQYQYKEACKKSGNFSVENLLYEAWEKTEKHYNSIVHSNQQLTDNSQFNPEAMLSFFIPSEDDFRIQGNEAHYLGSSNPDFLATESSHFFSENCQNSEEVFNVSQHFEVDIKTDFDGVDKNLIDSIVKPFKTTSKNSDKKAYFPSQPNLMSQAMNYPHKPSLLQNKVPFQETKRRDNYPNPDPVKAGSTLDTSLDQTLHVKQYNMPPYVDSNDLSTKEELASKFNVLEQPTKNTIPKDILQDDEFEKQFELALQRSRQTFELLGKENNLIPYQ